MRRRKNFESKYQFPTRLVGGDSGDKFYLAYNVAGIRETPKAIPPIAAFGIMNYGFAEKTIANIAKILVDTCGDWVEEYDPFRSDFVSYTNDDFFCTEDEEYFQDLPMNIMLDGRDAIAILFYRIVGSFTILDKDTIQDYLNWGESQWKQSKVRPYETAVFARENTPFAQALQCLLYHQEWSLGIDLHKSPKFQSLVNKYLR